ncbi:hypothetical protein GOBAR_AA34356 [Gossypium barbadense]|uniref:Pentacotripeptide-repeat region of PRORP domain-containing protein n=1 Tax=Gossypium barbadense TaxID=3634 RepID=A0A2P5W5J7_GOSBA|nr:hypothetical protein GOBAR_AA34356 [Gossypium barbadense]
MQSPSSIEDTMNANQMQLVYVHKKQTVSNEASIPINNNHKHSKHIRSTTITTITNICGNAELPSSDVLELAKNAYNEMLAVGFILNKINISNFSMCLCSVGKFEKACNIIHEMMRKGFIPDTSEMMRKGFIPDTSKYSKMVKGGCAPNVVTYTTLVHAYHKVRNVSKADELFEMMLSKGCIPNVVTYKALIDGHFKAGQIEKACQIYTRMCTNAEILYVDLYFKVVDSDAKALDVFTYGALLDGLFNAHKVKEAHDLLEAMLFKDKRLDLALKVLSKMLENSCASNVVTYTEISDGLCKADKTDEAYKLMFMMEEKGCSPNVVTYIAMIDGFGKADKAYELLEEMKQT